MDDVCAAPGTLYDYTLLGFALAAAIPFILANVALVVYRSRSYFRAQGGVILIPSSSLAGLVWIAAHFANNGHFPRVGPLRNCLLGICLWFVLMFLRLRRMYELSRGIDKWSWKYYVSVLLFVLPIVILSLVAEFFAPEFEGKCDPCELGRRWDAILASAYSLYWMVVFLYIYRLRKQQDDPLLATEYMYTLEYLALALVILLLTNIAVSTGASRTTPGRCFRTFSICCLVFFHFWTRFGWQLYMCLFRPEEMDKFEQALRYSGARALGATFSQTNHFPSCESAVLQAFSKASEELENYENDIRKLETQKAILKGKIRELQLQKRKGAAPSSF